MYRNYRVSIIVATSRLTLTARQMVVGIKVDINLFGSGLIRKRIQTGHQIILVSSLSKHGLF